MASGDTLASWTAFAAAPPPAANYATVDVRNNHEVLDFDDTTSEAAHFASVMPQNYSDTTGVTVYVTSASSSATSGTVGWTIEFERVTGLDVDADSFASAQTITATNVSGTSGIPTTRSVAVTKGANMDSVVAGDDYRVRVKRDTANDTAAGDAELISVEIRET
jgi:hypothetical protein